MEQVANGAEAFDRMAPGVGAELVQRDAVGKNGEFGRQVSGEVGEEEAGQIRGEGGGTQSAVVAVVVGRIGEAKFEVAPGKSERSLGLVVGKQAVVHREGIDGQRHHRRERGAGPRAGLRGRRNVGGAIVPPQQMELRTLDVERLQVHLPVEEREELETELNAGSAEQRARSGRFGAMQNEPFDGDLPGGGVEVEAAHLRPSARGPGDFREGAAADLLPEPSRLKDQEAHGEQPRQQEYDEGGEAEQTAAPGAHGCSSS